MGRPPRPDFLIVGAPKAGTSALHAALARHPDVFVTTPKEPKYWLCGDVPPPHFGGPGDRHSQREWIWQRERYEALFAGARQDQVRGESTPFYLWNGAARRRIAEKLPGVRLIAVLRDPIDRAYSNWMHLWCDGLEPVPDFLEAFALEEERIRRGWAPFWRYRELGLYGGQLAALRGLVDPAQVLVLRYRELVDDPVGTLDRACAFLGLRTGVLTEVPRDNSRPYVAPGWRTSLVGPLVRAGARAGQFAPPEVWRRIEPSAHRLLRGGTSADRPHLTPEQRGTLVPAFAEDIALLSELTGDDYGVWLSSEARGSFSERRAT